METGQDDLLWQLRKLCASEQEAKTKVITAQRSLWTNTGGAPGWGLAPASGRKSDGGQEESMSLAKIVLN